MARWGELVLGSGPTGDARDDFTRTYIRENCPHHVLEYICKLETQRDSALEELWGLKEKLKEITP